MEKITIHCNKQIVALLWSCFKSADEGGYLDEIEGLTLEEFISQLEGELEKASKGN